MAENKWRAVRLDIKVDEQAYMNAFGVDREDLDDDLTNAVAESVHEYLAQSVDSGRNIAVAGHTAHRSWYVNARGMLMYWQEDEVGGTGAWITVMDVEEHRISGLL